MRSFIRCRQGNFAVAFAVASLPLLGAVGMAVDYSRAVNVRSFIQAEADAAALSGVQLGSTGDPSRYLEYLRAATVARFGSAAWIDQLAIDAAWLSPTDFRVAVTGTVPVTILAAVPGFPEDVSIAALSTARMAEPKYIYTPPKVTYLDPEASDYNRISVYCFDPKETGKRKGKRKHMTEIADNAGSTYKYAMPQCDAGQMMSYKLMNVRDARTKPNRWDDKKAERYEYFTDTVAKGGLEGYDLGGLEILETVLCNSLAECRPKSKGGIIPEGKERTPQRATGVCAPGKFMYYGWEDRPPGAGWTDRDYDDIRIIIECPTIEQVGDRVVRLVR